MSNPTKPASGSTQARLEPFERTSKFDDLMREYDSGTSTKRKNEEAAAIQQFVAANTKETLSKLPDLGGTRSVPCPDCRGTGRITFDSRSNYPGAVRYHDCSTCSGSGELRPDPRELSEDDPD